MMPGSDNVCGRALGSVSSGNVAVIQRDIPLLETRPFCYCRRVNYLNSTS